MTEAMNNSANQMWKRSGTSLPFTEWLNREKAKGTIMANAEATEDFHQATGTDIDTDTGAKPMFKPAVILAGAVIVALAAMYLLKKTKNAS